MDEIIRYDAVITIHYKNFDSDVVISDEFTEDQFWNLYEYYNKIYSEQLDNNISYNDENEEWSTFAEDEQTEITFDVIELG